MGVDFVALLSHNLPLATLQLFPEIVQNNSFPTLMQVVSQSVQYHHNSRNWTTKWAWAKEFSSLSFGEEIAQEQTILLDSPGGFSFNFSMSTVKIYHVTRWEFFLSDAATQLLLRTMCRELAMYFNSERVIYIPDSSWPPSGIIDLFYEGWNLDQIEEKLRSNYGPPARVIKDIYQEREEEGSSYKLWEGNGYYIDTFTDL